MGVFDLLTGKSAADASRKAAADTYAKQQAASAGLRGAGDEFSSNLTRLAQGYSPWMDTGRAANDAVLNLIRDPSSVRSLPAYQFQLGEGTKAIDRSAASNGTLFSGRTGKALTEFGQGLADKTYGDQLARLLGISNQGLGATGSSIGTQAQGYGGQLGARTTAYGQDFNSAGTIGQGDIAAANAQSKGLQNLLNLGGSVIGSAFSGGMGGMGGGAGGFSSIAKLLGG